MKAISFCPPWGQAILNARKTIEVRSWTPKLEDLPMRVLVHSSQKEVAAGLLPENYHVGGFQGGVIIGEVTIVNSKKYLTFDQFMYDQHLHYNPAGWWRKGLFGWALKDPRWYEEPIKYKGRLRFFEVPFEETRHCHCQGVNIRTNSKDPSEITGSP